LFLEIYFYILSKYSIFFLMYRVKLKSLTINEFPSYFTSTYINGVYTTNTQNLIINLSIQLKLNTNIHMFIETH